MCMKKDASFFSMKDTIPIPFGWRKDLQKEERNEKGDRKEFGSSIV